MSLLLPLGVFSQSRTLKYCYWFLTWPLPKSSSRITTYFTYLKRLPLAERLPHLEGVSLSDEVISGHEGRVVNVPIRPICLCACVCVPVFVRLCLCVCASVCAYVDMWFVCVPVSVHRCVCMCLCLVLRSVNEVSESICICCSVEI